VAARQITDIDPREDTGRHPRPVLPPVEIPAPPRPEAPARRDRARLAVWGMVAIYAGLFSWLSVARYQTFSTGRFDLGNMVQAVWSTSEGRFLDTTDVSGVQFTRLGAHVDPILVLFTPLWWAWSSPESLLVAQAVIVALGAFPAFWLGRRWLGDDRLALAGAAVYLLYPALQYATLFDFHPVTLAAPLLLFCIWAAEEARWVTLGACATLAALTQEQVGLMLVGLAVWMWFRHPDRRRAAAILGSVALAWVVVALTVIIPAFAIDGSNPHIGRYSSLGGGPGDILLRAATHPWEVAEIVSTPGRVGYVGALLLPLLLLPLAAPFLMLVALPQFLINVLASTGPAQGVEYHYAVVITPFLIAAALLGLARLRQGSVPRWARRGHERIRPVLDRPPALASLMVGTVVIAGIGMGPLPLWGWMAPVGYGGSALHQFRGDAHTRALQQAVDMVPPGASVSATNGAGSHLSARRRIQLFPRIGLSNWVLVADSVRAREVARDRPTLRPPGYRAAARRLAASSRWKLVFSEENVRLYRRVRQLPE
jgi:uncharacterized membrane protein